MNFKKFLTLLIISLLSFHVFAQHNIKGSFPPLAGQQVKLVGFQDFDIYTIDSTTVSEQGKFTLTYAEKDLGMGYVASEDNSAYIVVFAPENTQLKGKLLNDPNSIDVVEGRQNQLFGQYASEHPRREQTLSAWDYLTRIYDLDSLFASHPEPRRAIEREKQRIKDEDNSFLESLNKDSYLKWFLPLRKLVSSVSTIAQYRTEEIPDAIKAFREMNYTDERLYKSGLLKETIENHFWLIENSGRSLEETFKEMNISIDSITENLKGDEEKFNQITAFLFKLLEKRSLFKSSEYLALKVLNQDACRVDDNLAAQLESYRAMKVGNTAPDFKFKGDIFAPGYAKAPRKLSDIQTNYTVLVFGSSWCPACPQELVQIVNNYNKWKEQGVEVVFVSLDDDKDLFKKFATSFPFISMSDYKKWESPIVQSYHVFATPTVLILNNKREIVLKPRSAEQLDAWINWYLVKKNK